MWKIFHGIFAFFSSKHIKCIFISVEFPFCSLFSFSNNTLFYSHHPVYSLTSHSACKCLYLNNPFLLLHPLLHGSFSTSLDKSSTFLSHLTAVLSTKEITGTRFTYFLHKLVIWMNMNTRNLSCSVSISNSTKKLPVHCFTAK